VTAVEVRNLDSTSLLLERLSVPVPSLSIFAGDDGRMWTEGISVTRGEGSTDLQELRVDEGPPPWAGDTTRLSGPRQSAATQSLIRALSDLL
jgi:hypothetical protein